MIQRTRKKGMNLGVMSVMTASIARPLVRAGGQLVYVPDGVEPYRASTGKRGQ